MDKIRKRILHFKAACCLVCKMFETFPSRIVLFIFIRLDGLLEKVLFVENSSAQREKSTWVENSWESDLILGMSLQGSSRLFRKAWDGGENLGFYRRKWNQGRVQHSISILELRPTGGGSGSACGDPECRVFSLSPRNPWGAQSQGLGSQGLCSGRVRVRVGCYVQIWTSVGPGCLSRMVATPPPQVSGGCLGRQERGIFDHFINFCPSKTGGSED